MLRNQEDVVKLIQNDHRMMEIIKAASKLNLPDWWICAGFVRSKIWDTLHGFEKRTNTPDVDVMILMIKMLMRRPKKIRS